MKEETNEVKKIVIVGGGVAGVRLALDLDRYTNHAQIILIDNKFQFEYHSALYRIITGGSVMEVCIPYEDIFKKSNVRVMEETIDHVVPEEKLIWGTSGSKYHYDSLVLAIGSESNYFGIDGLEKYAFEFKTTNDALRLRKHLESIFKNLKDASHEEKAKSANIVVVGAGATGVELCGQLSAYGKRLAKKNGLDPSFVVVDLIEAQGRVLPLFRKEASKAVEKRLRSLGVNIYLNRIVEESELESICMKTMEIDTKTVIWTAGVKPHHLYSTIRGVESDKRGCVMVNEDFQVKDLPGVYVIGDGAESKYGGMAQTAQRQGAYLAKVLAENTLMGTTKDLPLYEAKKPVFVVPVGEKWAVAQWGSVLLFGYDAWLLRRVADFRYFLSILPFKKAFRAFRQGNIPCRDYEQERKEGVSHQEIKAEG